MVYLRPIIIKLGEKIQDMEVPVIYGDMLKRLKIDIKNVEEVCVKQSILLLHRKEFDAFFPIFLPNKYSRFSLEEHVAYALVKLKPIIKDKKARSVIDEIVDSIEIEKLEEIIDLNSENDWKQLVKVLRKAINIGFKLSKIVMGSGAIINSMPLKDPKTGIKFNVKLKHYFLRLPPDYPISFVLAPKIKTESGGLGSISSDGKNLATEIFNNFSSKLKSVSFYVGSILLNFGSGDIIYDVFNLHDECTNNIPLPSTYEPSYLRIERWTIKSINPADTIVRLYYSETPEVSGRPYEDLIKIGPYDLKDKKFDVIRLCFAINSNEDRSVIRLFEDFHTFFLNNREKLVKILGCKKGGNKFLDIKVISNIIKYRSPDELIDQLVDNEMKPLKDAMHLNEADIVVIGTSAHRSAPYKTKAMELYDDTRKTLLEHGFANQFASSYETLKTPMGILAHYLKYRNRINQGKTYEGFDYVLRNFMLNIYTKVSGKPWIVRQDKDSMAHAVVALGFAKSEAGYGIGASVIIDEYGDLVSINQWSIPPNTIKTRGLSLSRYQMLNLVKETIEYLRKERSYLSDYSIAIYKYGKYTDDELRGIRDAISSLNKNVRISPISILGKGLYPPSNKKYVVLSEKLLLFSPLKQAYASAAILWDIGKPYNLYNRLGQVMNNIEALLKFHWQSLFPRMRHPAILKAARRIARDLLLGYKIPTDDELKKTPWFI